MKIKLLRSLTSCSLSLSGLSSMGNVANPTYGLIKLWQWCCTNPIEYTHTYTYTGKHACQLHELHAIYY